MNQRPRPLFRRPESWPEARFLADILRTEAAGGLLLVVAVAVAMAWANSPWREAYETLRTTVTGPESLHLDLDLATWAADGLLAVFFFVVGLELKREFVAGDLRHPRRAAVPVAAALGGMAMPALLFVLINLGTGGDALRGWAIPTATDIAFALAVLAVLGSHLPSGLRSFLLTLAVVDDLIAITIIALIYTDTLDLVSLAGSLGCVALFAWLVRWRWSAWWLSIPLGVAAWVLMHESGVHATIAGVLLGVAVPLIGGDGQRLIERLEHLWRPVSAGVAVPVFAFFASGVSLAGSGGLGELLDDRVAIGVMVGLVVGKLLGVLGTTYAVARFTGAQLDDDLTWTDLVGVSLLAGIGFTVSLLIGELAFGSSGERIDRVRLAVLLASLTSALLAAIVVRRRNAVYRRIHEAETLDTDADKIPDVYDPTP
ncbi:MAG: Na+/H+ antiporter NhaA [Acidimicrobiia bacterium]|nr:Na+/H+ antiporter NhaA [Acidimicrobiia bacterium]